MIPTRGLWLLPGSSHLLQLPKVKAFLDLCSKNGSTIRRGSMGSKTGPNEHGLLCGGGFIRNPP